MKNNTYNFNYRIGEYEREKPYIQGFTWVYGFFIVKKVQEVTAQYSEINKFILDEIIRLKEYKTTLINDAVTGKIKVA